MKNAINKQFEMNQGAHAENNTETSFRNPERVAQAGGMPMMASAPLNYGTTPALKHEPGHGRQEGESEEDYGNRVYQEALAREKKRKEAKKKRESGEYTPPKRDGDFSILGGLVTGNTKKYGGR